tara:strand:+ start:91 stop:267 length:177 start_codon:yes stop_codon:yes gene_type:complete
MRVQVEECIKIDLYTGKTEIIEADFDGLIEGLEMIGGDYPAWKGEEYMVVKMTIDWQA